MDKQNLIDAILRDGQAKAAAHGEKMHARVSEFLESLDARAGKNAAMSAALSLDLLQVMLAMMTIVKKAVSEHSTLERLLNDCKEIHARTTSHMLELSITDDTIIDRELKTVLMLMEEVFDHNTRMTELANKVAAKISAIVNDE